MWCGGAPIFTWFITFSLVAGITLATSGFVLISQHDRPSKAHQQTLREVVYVYLVEVWVPIVSGTVLVVAGIILLLQSIAYACTACCVYPPAYRTELEKMAFGFALSRRTRVTGFTGGEPTRVVVDGETCVGDAVADDNGDVEGLELGAEMPPCEDGLGTRDVCVGPRNNGSSMSSGIVGPPLQQQNIEADPLPPDENPPPYSLPSGPPVHMMNLEGGGGGGGSRGSGVIIYVPDASGVSISGKSENVSVYSGERSAGGSKNSRPTVYAAASGAGGGEEGEDQRRQERNTGGAAKGGALQQAWANNKGGNTGGGGGGASAGGARVPSVAGYGAPARPAPSLAGGGWNAGGGGGRVTREMVGERQQRMVRGRQQWGQGGRFFSVPAVHRIGEDGAGGRRVEKNK